jgi:acyl-CoA synthetase (NDP forming)
VAALNERRPLEVLLNPRTVAVIGASPDRTRFGGRAIHNLQRKGFSGTIVPVNPKYGSIGDLTCYPSLAGIPQQVDVAILTISTESVMAALEECAASGVGLAVVFGAGFAEAGSKGVELQQRLSELSKTSGMRVLGPNCLGFLNATANVAASPAGALDLPELRQGGISIVSQSGMLAFESFLTRGLENGYGFRYVVSTGNEADIDTTEVLELLIDDELTNIVVVYLEGLKNPSGFVRQLRRAREKRKPIVLYKVGRSAEASRAARSHTAAIAGSDAVHEALFRREGVIRVDDLDDLWEIPALLSDIGQLKGPRVAVVGTSGGLNGMLADELRKEGLQLPAFSDAVQEDLRALVPWYGTVENPVDLTGYFVGAGREEAFADAVKIVDRDPYVDIVIFAPGIDQAKFALKAGSIAEAFRTCRKPVVVVSAGGEVADAALAPIRRKGIHVFHSPSRCARALGRLLDYSGFSGRGSSFLSAESAQSNPQPPIGTSAGVLSYERGEELLTRFGIPTAAGRLVETSAQAAQAAIELGLPVAVKAANPAILHKSDLGVVLIGLRDADSVRAAAVEIQTKLGAAGAPLLVQQMVIGGQEAIVGVQQDAQFGPVVLLGMGGVLVELLDDTVLGLPPITHDEALVMINRLKGAALFHGFRGTPPSDIRALQDLIVAVSRLAIEHGESLQSLDLNPVMVLPQGQGVKVVDWVVIAPPVAGG